MRAKQPELSRALLASLFAAAFLANGGAGLWVSLTAAPMHVNGLSAVVTVFGLIALVAALQQFHRAFSSPAQRGRGTTPGLDPGVVEGASSTVLPATPPPSASPPPPPLGRGGEFAFSLSESA